MLKNVIPTFLVKSKVASSRDGQNTEPKQCETSVDTFGRTLLHRACWDGDVVKMRELLADSDSSKLNAKDQWGRTPLWCAVTQGNIEAVRLMVEHDGVRLDTTDSYGKDLEFRAKEKGYTKIVEVLQKGKLKRQLITNDLNLDGLSQKSLSDQLESSEHKLFDLKKKHAQEKLELEISCSEAVEKLILENEQKISKIQERHETEQGMMASQVASINEKLNKKTCHPASAPATPTSQPSLYLPPCPECPVCMENLLPPRRIFQCGNGHLICEICQPKMKEQKCPSCLQGFVGRAIAMEQHLSTLFMT